MEPSRRYEIWDSQNIIDENEILHEYYVTSIGKYLITFGGNVLLLSQRPSSFRRENMTSPLGSFDLECEDTTVHQKAPRVGLLDSEYEVTTVLRNIGNTLPTDKM
jgi:hypothetical protein